MDEDSGNVQRASTYSGLPKRERRERARERETIGKVREVSSNGVMEEGSKTVHKASAHPDLRERETYIGNVSEAASNGVMDEGSGKVWKANTHVASSIVMDVAIVESHVAAADVKPRTLQNEEGKGHGKVIQRGDGRRFREGSKAEY